MKDLVSSCAPKSDGVSGGARPALHSSMTSSQSVAAPDNLARSQTLPERLTRLHSADSQKHQPRSSYDARLGVHGVPSGKKSGKVNPSG